MPFPTSNVAIALAFGATIGVASTFPAGAEDQKAPSTSDTAAAKEKTDSKPNGTKSDVDVSVGPGSSAPGSPGKQVKRLIAPRHLAIT
jgi:hypothetical protein